MTGAVVPFATVTARLGQSKEQSSGDAASGCEKVCYQATDKGKPCRLTFGKGEMDVLATLDDGRYHGKPLYPGSPDGRSRSKGLAPIHPVVDPVFSNGLRLGMTKAEVKALLSKMKIMTDHDGGVGFYSNLPKDDCQDGNGLNIEVIFVEGTASSIQVDVGD